MAVQFIDLGGASNTLTLGDDDYIIIGTDGDNTLTLGNGDDKLTLGNGNNTLTMGGGTNQIKAGTGNNTITINGLGSVTIKLASGNNTVTVDDGPALIVVGDGKNTIVTGDGKSTIHAGEGVNTITTGNGNSAVTVGDGAGNTVVVGTGENVITLGIGIGNLLQTGGGGNTLLVESAAIGTDTIQGAMTTNDGTGNLVILTTAGMASIIGVTGFQTFRLADGGLNSLAVNDGNFIRLPGKSISVLGGDSGNTVNASTLSAANSVRLIGGLAVDTFIGGAGNDSFDGKGGADVMTGGLGNDRYYVDDAADQVIEAAGGGTDTIFALSNYSLGAGQAVEFLRAYAGTPALRLNGNELNNRIYGGAEGDTLNGMAGADVMVGGVGNDRYFVDQAGDLVVEAAGEGIDTILTLSDYALRQGQEVEQLRAIAGAPGVRLSGNEFDNSVYGADNNDTIDGKAGADLMVGLAGDDRYFIDNTGDRVVEAVGGGADTVYTTVDFALGTGQEVEIVRALVGAGALRLSGNEMNNRIFGGSGDDTIDGMGGDDRMAGGAGDDRYFVNSIDDTVVEAAAMGTDIVYSFAPSFILGTDIENLRLMDGATSGTGNGLANVIRSLTGADTILDGKAGDDRLVGGDGADRLNGGQGVDTLTGGAGVDSFVFLKGAADGDRITDFAVGTDHIDFYGYDIGATFAKVAGAWTVTDGASSEVINFTVFPVTLTAADYHFY